MTLLELRHARGRSLEVGMASGHTLAAYHYGPELARSYFHPLAPPGAPPLTLAGPHDHVFHQGLFFAWRFVDGVDFWQFGHGRVATRRLDITEHSADRVAWEQDNEWLAGPEPGTALLNETRSITVRLAGNDAVFISWVSTFRAQRSTRLHACERGYGGLNVRLIRDFQLYPRILWADGEGDAAAHVRGVRSPWAGWYGRYDATGDWGGLILFDHPDNPDHPSPVFAPRSMTEMAFIGRGFTFGRDHIVAPEDPLTLRYGVLARRGEPAVDHDGWWQSYVADEGTRATT